MEIATYADVHKRYRYGLISETEYDFYKTVEDLGIAFEHIHDLISSVFVVDPSKNICAMGKNKQECLNALLFQVKGVIPK